MDTVLVVMTGFFCFFINLPCSKSATVQEDELLLVHALFRHGLRTIEWTYPTSPYINESYWPYGIGQLTNEGKRESYNVGLALRKRYNEFLGPLYNPDIVEPRSSDKNRTKMTLEIVLAGLFRPVGEQIFIPGLAWQPVPYNYEPLNNDMILASIFCPNFGKKFIEYTQSLKTQPDWKSTQNTYRYLSENSGLNISDSCKLMELYTAFLAEEEWGFKLPSWTDSVYPSPMKELATKYFLHATATPELKKIVAGPLLHKILDDSKAKITGTLIPPSRKIFLYSGHQETIASFLSTLDIFDPPHIPPYAGYVLVEVRRINGIYGIKIYYENYQGPPGPKLLKLPTCEEFCPMSQFESLIKEYKPTPATCG